MFFHCGNSFIELISSFVKCPHTKNCRLTEYYLHATKSFSLYSKKLKIVVLLIRRAFSDKHS